MSRMYVQIINPVYVGDRQYFEMAGDFSIVDHFITAETGIGTILIPESNASCVVMLDDDFDVGTLSDSVILIN